MTLEVYPLILQVLLISFYMYAISPDSKYLKGKRFHFLLQQLSAQTEKPFWSFSY